MNSSGTCARRIPITSDSRVDRFLRAVDLTGGIFLGIVTTVVFVSAVGRYLLAWPIPDNFDIARLLLGIVVMWGFAGMGYRGGHIRVDLAEGALPPRLRRWIDAFAWTMLLVFTLLLSWKLFGRVTSMAASSESTMDLRLPLWPFVALIWLATVAAVLTTAARILRIMRGEAR